MDVEAIRSDANPAIAFEQSHQECTLDTQAPVPHSLGNELGTRPIAEQLREGGLSQSTGAVDLDFVQGLAVLGRWASEYRPSSTDDTVVRVQNLVEEVRIGVGEPRAPLRYPTL